MLSVRVARQEDAPAVAAVHVHSWQAAYRGLLPDDYLDALRPEDRVALYTFDSPDANVPATIVALENGAICGFVTTGPSRDADAAGMGEVLALYVVPEAWGTGVGARLVSEARAHLSQMGFTEAVLWVLVGNDRAQHFYRTDGWQADDGRRRQELWGVVVDEVRFRRRLP